MSIFKSSTKLIKFYVQTTYICHINIKWLISSHLGKKFFSPSATTFVYIKWDLWGPDSFSYQNRIFQHQLESRGPMATWSFQKWLCCFRGLRTPTACDTGQYAKMVTQQVEREGDKLLFFSLHTRWLSLWSGLCVKGKDDQGLQHQEPWMPEHQPAARERTQNLRTHAQAKCVSSGYLQVSAEWLPTFYILIYPYQMIEMKNKSLQ